MTEIWFRGQSTAVPPAKPGAHIHDFGDGLYLTDRLDVAKQYADTRVSQGGGKPEILKVNIKTGDLGKVLDLRKDARWAAYLDKPTIPGRPEMTPRALIKLSNENYFSFFKQFLKLHKIDISKFDSVIGPELVRGGNQMCILHKKGALSSLGRRIVALFRPLIPKITGGGLIVPKPKISTRPGRIQGRIVPRVRFRPMIRKIGGNILTMVLMVLAAYLEYKSNQKFLNMTKRKVEAEIDEILTSTSAMLDALEIDYGGKKPHANVRFDLIQETIMDMPMPDGVHDAPPWVTLIHCIVSSKPVNKVDPVQIKANLGGTVRRTPHHVSVEIPLTKEMRQIYAAYEPAFEWYERVFSKPRTWHSEADRWQMMGEAWDLYWDRHKALFGEDDKALTE